MLRLIKYFKASLVIGTSNDKLSTTVHITEYVTTICINNYLIDFTPHLCKSIYPLKTKCLLQLDSPTVRDDYWLRGSAGSRADGLHGLDDLHALHHGSEHGVLAVEVRGRHSGDEELTAVGVGTRIGHGQKTRSVMLQLEVLISKLRPVDALSASPITSSKVSALTHELWDDAVEVAALEVQRLARLAHALLPRAESQEVLSSLRYDICAKFEDNASGRSAADLDVEVGSGMCHGGESLGLA